METSCKKDLSKDIVGDPQNYYVVPIEGCYLYPAYRFYAEDIKNFEVYDSDIWITGFPRSGTNWSSEMIWLVANNCNFDKAKAPKFERIRFIDMGFLYHDHKNAEKRSHPMMANAINYTKGQSHPRIIRTHLPFHLLPKQIRNGEKHPKIFHICRNPMDVCVSYYYHLASITYTGSFEEFCDQFLADEVLYGPYFGNVLPYWKMRDQPNLLFLKYEEMKADLPKVINKVATFLGKTVTEQQIENLQKHLSFESMKKNPSIVGGKIMDVIKSSGVVSTPLLRSGAVGGYKKEMPEAYINRFEKWMKDNLGETDLEFQI